MAVVAKFLCIEKGETGYQPEQKQAKVILTPVTGGSEENKQFWQWTPTGKIELNMINHGAAEQFEVGKEYYVHFSSGNVQKVVEEKPNISLTEKDLMTILAKNNEQLRDAIKKQEQAEKDNCPDIEGAVRAVGVESGEAIVIVQLIRYLRGEIELDAIAQ